MRQLQRVLWTKGVLLNPQHLQMQDRYLEDLIQFRLSALAFAPWGISRLAIDRDALAGGVLSVTELAGLLPDGLVFDVPRADVAPPPLSLAAHWNPDQEDMVVYLAVPEHRVGSRNVAEGLDGGARFRSEVVLRRDDNTGLAEKPVRVARNNLRLLAEGESHAGSVTLPVARVLRGAGGAPELDPSFIPPLLDIGASPRLRTLVRRLLELLTARSAALSGMRRQRRGGVAEFGVSDVANFWLLYTVNGHLPRFKHFLEGGRGHPADLYEAMAELAGALTASFATDLQPADLPAYDHHDLTTCFGLLDEQLRALLDTAVPAQHVSLPLRKGESSVHAVALDQERYFGATEMYLAVAARNRAEELVRRVPQLLKVSSADRIEQLIRRALPGVELTHTADPPGAIPIKLDRQYFALGRSGEDWDAVRRSRHLAVYVPGDLEDPELELVILLPREGTP